MSMPTSRQMQYPVRLDPVTLQIPLRHKYLNREAYHGSGSQPAVQVDLAGFSTTITGPDPSKERMDKEARRRAAYTFSGSMKSLPSTSASYLDLPLATNTKALSSATRSKTYEGLSQNRMLANSDEDYWMVRYVEGEADEYTWEVHLNQLRYAVANLTIAPNNENLDHKVHRERLSNNIGKWEEQKERALMSPASTAIVTNEASQVSFR